MSQNKNDRIKKLASLDCSPCDNGIIINTAKQVCIISDKRATNKTCHDLYDAVVLGSIDTPKYLNAIKQICMEKQSKDTITSLLDMALKAVGSK